MRVWDEHRQNTLVDKKHGAAAYAVQKLATWSEKLLYHSPL